MVTAEFWKLTLGSRLMPWVKSPSLLAVSTLTGLVLIMALWWAGSLLAPEAWAAHLRGTTLALEVAKAKSVEPASSSADTCCLDDYAQKLPQTPIVHKVLQELQRACAAHGVQLIGVASADRPASLEQLGSVDLTVQLRGTYPNIKLALSDLLGRYDSVLVARFAARRTGSSQEVESQVSLTLLAKPGATLPITKGRL